MHDGCLRKRAAAQTLLSILVLLAGTGLAQTASPPPTPPDKSPSAPAVMPSPVSTPSGGPQLTSSDLQLYVISPGDTLDIAVFGSPDLTQRVRVTSNGDVYLPLVNYVHVGGLNVQDAQAALESALKNGKFMVSPHVTVLIAEYGSGVVLMGEVMKPGVYPVTASKGMLFDILSEAGGPTPNAGQTVTITHRGNTGQQVVFLSHDPAKAMEANVPVYQGDTVMVSKAGMIFVVGEVVQPSAFVMESKSGYTALKALAMAHGATRVAKLSQAKIVRQTPTGVEEISVPLDKIAQSKAPDTVLQADDILLVPTNHAKIAAAQAVSMAQSIVVLGATRVW